MNCQRRLLFALFSFTLTIIAIDSSAQANSELLLQTSEVNNLMVHFKEDEGNLIRFYVIPNTAERRDRLRLLYKDYLSQLEGLPFDNFSINGKVDYLLLKRDIESKLYLLDIEEKECQQIADLVSNGNPIYELEKKRRRGNKLPGNEVASQLTNVNNAINEVIKAIDKVPNMSRALAARAEGTIKGQHKALRSVFEFYNGYDPDFTWWATEPVKTLDSTLARYAALIKTKIDASTLPKDDGSGIIGFPIGRNELLRQLSI